MSIGMIVNIQYLEEFLTIAKYKSFSEASDELSIGQSALSKHISALEKELDVLLFYRNTRNVSLTPIGEMILPLVKQIVNRSQKIRGLCASYTSDSIEEAKRNDLSIAIVPVSAAYKITELFATFTKDTSISIRSLELEPNVIYELLTSGQTRLAFVRFHEDLLDNYDVLPYVIEKILVVLPANHRLAHKKEVSLNELKNERFLLISKSAELYRICMNLFTDAMMIPKTAFTGTRPENIVNMVSLGMGVSLLPEHFFNFYKDEGVVALPLCSETKTTIALIKRKGVKLSVQEARFWEFVDTKNLVSNPNSLKQGCTCLPSPDEIRF